MEANHMDTQAKDHKEWPRTSQTEVDHPDGDGDLEREARGHRPTAEDAEKLERDRKGDDTSTPEDDESTTRRPMAL